MGSILLGLQRAGEVELGCAGAGGSTAEQPQLSPGCCQAWCLITAQQQDNSCSLALFGL